MRILAGVSTDARGGGVNLYKAANPYAMGYGDMIRPGEGRRKSSYRIDSGHSNLVT